MGQAAGACWSKSTRKELSPNTSPASKSFSFSSFLSNSFKMSLFVRVLGFGRPSKSISSGGSSTTAAGWLRPASSGVEKANASSSEVGDGWPKMLANPLLSVGAGRWTGEAAVVGAAAGLGGGLAGGIWGLCGTAGEVGLDVGRGGGPAKWSSWWSPKRSISTWPWLGLGHGDGEGEGECECIAGGWYPGTGLGAAALSRSSKCSEVACMAPVTDRISCCVSCGGDGLDGGLGGGVGLSGFVCIISGIGDACGDGVAASVLVDNSSGRGMSTSNKSSINWWWCCMDEASGRSYGLTLWSTICMAPPELSHARLSTCSLIGADSVTEAAKGL